MHPKVSGSRNEANITRQGDNDREGGKGRARQQLEESPSTQGGTEPLSASRYRGAHSQAA